MREDIMEALESAYPSGFVVFYLDNDGAVRESGYNMDKSKFLTSFYHLGLAVASLVGSDNNFDI